MNRYLLGIVLVSWSLSCGKKSGIRTDIDPAEAQAQQEVPVQAEVKPLVIPYDPSLPKWVVTVEPFVQGSSGITAGNSGRGSQVMIVPGGLVPTAIYPAVGGSRTDPGSQVGFGITAQLLSAIQRGLGNAEVVDWEIYKHDPEKIIAGMKTGELGPYVIRGVVTQHNQSTDASVEGESSNGAGLGLIPYAGPIIRLGKGTKSVQRTTYRGMVAFDAQIVDPRSGRIVSSFTAEGTFTSIDTMTTKTSWGKTKVTSTGCSSAIGQALLAATNKAVSEVHIALAKQSQLAKN